MLVSNTANTGFKIAQMRREMLEAAENLDFEHAAERNDSIQQLKTEANG